MSQNEKRTIKTQPEAAGGRNKKRQKRPESVMSLWTPYLPPELWVFIFKIFSFKNMRQLASVCRDWAGLWRRYISQTPERRIQMYGSMEILYSNTATTSAYEHCLVGAAAAGDIKWVYSMMDKYGLCSARSQYRAVVAHKLYRFWALGDGVLFWKICVACDLQSHWRMKLLRGLVKLGKVKHIRSWMKQSKVKLTFETDEHLRGTFTPGSMEAMHWILNYNKKNIHVNIINAYTMAILAMKRGNRVLFMEAMCRNKGSKFYTHDNGDIWRWASYYLCFWALPLLTKLPKSVPLFLLPILSVSKSRLHVDTPFELVKKVYLKQAIGRYIELARKAKPEEGVLFTVSKSRLWLCLSEWRELYLQCAKYGNTAALEFFTEELEGEAAAPTYLAPYVECGNVESWKWFWAKGCSVSHLNQNDWERIGNKGDEALAKYMCQNPCGHQEPLMSSTSLLNIMCSSRVSCRLFRFLRYLCCNTEGSLVILKNSYYCITELQRLYRCIGGKTIPQLGPLVPEYKQDSTPIGWPRRKSLIVAVRGLLQRNAHLCNGFCTSVCLCCGQTQKKKEKKV